jgi:hypothetical protein
MVVNSFAQFWDFGIICWLRSSRNLQSDVTKTRGLASHVARCAGRGVVVVVVVVVVAVVVVVVVVVVVNVVVVVVVVVWMCVRFWNT